MIIKALPESITSQATSTTTTHTDSTGLGTEISTEQAEGSESTLETELKTMNSVS